MEAGANITKGSEKGSVRQEVLDIEMLHDPVMAAKHISKGGEIYIAPEEDQGADSGGSWLAAAEPLAKYAAYVEDEGTASSSYVKSEGEGHIADVETQNISFSPQSLALL